MFKKLFKKREVKKGNGDVKRTEIKRTDVKQTEIKRAEVKQTELPTDDSVQLTIKFEIIDTGEIVEVPYNDDELFNKMMCNENARLTFG